MPVTAKPRKRSTPNYYVYYNDWTGEIYTLGCSPQPDNPQPFVVTREETVREIIRGRASESHYVVSLDSSDDRKLISKSEILRLREKENDLFLLPHQRMREWDIRARLYMQNKRLVFDINREKIRKMVAHNMQREIHLNRPVTFEFYLVKRNRPDYLLEVIEIDAATLINDRLLAFNIEHLLPHTDMRDIDIMTRRVFRNYYYKILDDTYVEVLDEDRLAATARRWQVASSTSDAHIVFEQEDDIVTVTSNVSSEQLDDVQLWQRMMNFYVVGNTPDQYYDQFEVDISELRMGQAERFQVEFDLDKVQIMYHNPLLKVRKGKSNESHAN